MTAESPLPLAPTEAPVPPPVSPDFGVSPPDPKGLRWISTGAGLGLMAAATGLAVPVSLVLLATYSPVNLLAFGPTLIAATGFLAVAAALLFAMSLLAFRTGFFVFHKFQQRFWSATVLCLVGTVGYGLLILPAATALVSSNALFQCVQAAPVQALSCLQSVAPLAGYVAVLAFWLVWLGQLGIVVGLAFTGRRFREPSLHIGTVLYGLLLLVFIAPFLGLVFASSVLADAVVAAVVLGILAPAYVAYGSGRPRGTPSRTERPTAVESPPVPTAMPGPEIDASAGTGI